MATKKKTPATQIMATLADYQSTFTTAHGKRVLRKMMEECHCMTPSFVEQDSHGSAFNEGRRSAVLDICNRLKYDLVRMEHDLTQQPEDDSDYID